ncbi:hypothetical protein MP228_005081 [Amoeboaphelidium protococcarum]|nr:hypothetical protein MP228_005081 [Amoeboaphelidium protococcarum]
MMMLRIGLFVISCLNTCFTVHAAFLPVRAYFVPSKQMFMAPFKRSAAKQAYDQLEHVYEDLDSNGMFPYGRYAHSVYNVQVYERMKEIGHSRLTRVLWVPNALVDLFRLSRQVMAANDDENSQSHQFTDMYQIYHDMVELLQDNDARLMRKLLANFAEITIEDFAYITTLLAGSIGKQIRKSQNGQLSWEKDLIDAMFHESTAVLGCYQSVQQSQANGEFALCSSLIVQSMRMEIDAYHKNQLALFAELATPQQELESSFDSVLPRTFQNSILHGCGDLINGMVATDACLLSYLVKAVRSEEIEEDDIIGNDYVFAYNTVYAYEVQQLLQTHYLSDPILDVYHSNSAADDDDRDRDFFGQSTDSSIAGQSPLAKMMSISTWPSTDTLSQSWDLPGGSSDFSVGDSEDRFEHGLQRLKLHLNPSDDNVLGQQLHVLRNLQKSRVQQFVDKVDVILMNGDFVLTPDANDNAKQRLMRDLEQIDV